jgi:hypothetical protein
MESELPLTSALESLLSRDNILRSPLLSSLIAGRNQLPISELCDLPMLLPLAPSVRSVWEACKESPYLKDMIRDDMTNTMISVPFSADRRALRIRNIPRSITNAEVSHFLATICGAAPYRIWREHPILLVRFESEVELFAVWAALGYCPLDGVLLDAELALGPPKRPKSREPTHSRGKKSFKGRSSLPPQRDDVRLCEGDFSPLAALG